MIRVGLALGAVALALLSLTPSVEGAPLPVGPMAGLAVGANSGGITGTLLAPVNQVASGTKKVLGGVQSALTPKSASHKTPAKSLKRTSTSKTGVGSWFSSMGSK